jgi:hypothetical protein
MILLLSIEGSYSVFFLRIQEKTHTQCVLFFYTWDSFTNHSHPTSILKYFDKKFTFDSDDAFKL